ncbi:MAG: hypothetical protein FD149_1410 [Rhodospirillaceae bacterium]|nr:MAG: hypothetical protein FD149_1410 [Rhodospirillaceae bacterium]
MPPRPTRPKAEEDSSPPTRAPAQQEVETPDLLVKRDDFFVLQAIMHVQRDVGSLTAKVELMTEDVKDVGLLMAKVERSSAKVDFLTVTMGFRGSNPCPSRSII